jgi:hypothetical protein
MTTALAFMQRVFRRAQMNPFTSFATSQSFPANIALDVLQRAVEELNSRGRYEFMLTSVDLAYSVGVYEYTMSTVAADLNGEGITKIELTESNFETELISMEVQQFRNIYRRSAILTVKPVAWTDYGDTLELNSIPNQDYGIKVWYYALISKPTLVTDDIDVPERYEGVLEDMAYAYLLEALGREDFSLKYQLADKQANKFVANTSKKRSRANVMPRAF